MGEAPSTRMSLLVRIRDSRDGEAWSWFVEVYGPLVCDYGRRHGLQDADAADLAQEVLRTVAAAAGKFAYDPQRGSFRSWLFTVARTRRIDLEGRRARQARTSGDLVVADQLDHVPAQGAELEEDEWRLAYRRRLFDWAAERARGEFRDSTWQAFRQTALEGLGPREVARDLGMSVGAVYMAKSRVLARLQELIDQVRGDDEDR